MCAVVDAFEIQHQDTHFVAGEEVGGKLECRYIRFVAGRDDVIEAHAFIVGERDGTVSEAAALRDERHRPLAQIGMRIKEALRPHGPAMVFGYFTEHNLYIPTRENVRLDLYQAQSLRVQYTCPVGWSLDVEEEMVKGTLAVVGAEINIDPRKQKSYPLRRDSA